MVFYGLHAVATATALMSLGPPSTAISRHDSHAGFAQAQGLEMAAQPRCVVRRMPSSSSLSLLSLVFPFLFPVGTARGRQCLAWNVPRQVLLETSSVLGAAGVTAAEILTSAFFYMPEGKHMTIPDKHLGQLDSIPSESL